MADVLLEVPSTLLDSKQDWFLTPGRHINEKKLLSAIKCATLLYQHIQGESLETLAEDYDCYPADLYLLKMHIGWILDAEYRIFSVLSRAKTRMEVDEGDEDIKTQPSPSLHEQIAHSLKQMVEYGIPRHALGLVAIKGIGQKRAQALVGNGIFTQQQLLETNLERLAEILKLRVQTIEKMLDDMAEPQNQIEIQTDSPTGSVPVRHKKPHKNWPTEVDPYRLRRALELEVDHQSAEYLQISGGTEPHRIQVTEDTMRNRSYKCDCMDFQKGTSQCKHVLRSRLEHNDPEILGLLKRMANTKPQELRYSLGELWIKAGRTFDAFLGRNVDYKGNRFLTKANNRRRNR